MSAHNTQATAPRVLDEPVDLLLVHRHALRVVMLSQLLGGAGLAAGVTVGALLAEQMLGTDSLAGLPTALVTLGSALTAYVVGWVTQRRGRRFGLAAGFTAGALGAAGVASGALLDNVIVLFVALFVYGAGTVGLAAVMAARNSAATTIIAVDRHAARLRLAEGLGATHTVDATDTDPVQAVNDICGGPADASLDCTGNTSVIRQAIDSVGMLGTALLIGGAPAAAEFSADHLTTLWGKTIRGTLGGSGHGQQLIGALMDLHTQGRFPFDQLVQYFPLDRIEDAVEASYRGAVVKPILTMPH